MKTIYKYPLRLRPHQFVEMPTGAHLVRFAMQAGVPCLWAIVDTEQPAVAREFRILGTGHEIPPNCGHVGSCEDGAYIWHLFEATP